MAFPDKDPHKTNQDTFSVLNKFLGEKEDSFFAVYDGHGPFGDECANFAKKDLPKSINKFSKQIRVQKFKETNDTLPKEERLPFNPKLFPKLTAEEWEDVIQKAHIECNEKLVKKVSFTDSNGYDYQKHKLTMYSKFTLLFTLTIKPNSKLSGTTAISVLFSDGHIIVSNVGDSRAILGFRAPADMSPSDLEYDVEEEKIEVSPAQDDEVVNFENNGASIFDEGKLYAIPLSSDQTPWRLDERKRILKAGGRILTSDQMEGLEPVTNDWGDVVLGEDIDTEGTIPRVWLQDKDIPGTSFTRSIGDSIAESCGVNAEPEILKKRLYKNYEYLVIASDGVFEFLTNQTVIDICDKCSDPLEACEEIVKASYAEWLRHEDRTDDITVIVFFMKNETEIIHKSQDFNLIKSLAPKNIKK